eukprot:10544767-Alexandrium_andersonii.AAC.1
MTAGEPLTSGARSGFAACKTHKPKATRRISRSRTWPRKWREGRGRRTRRRWGGACADLSLIHI